MKGNYYGRSLSIALLRSKAVRNHYIYRQLLERVKDHKRRKSFYQPPILLVENTNRCNAQCAICVRPRMNRDSGYMRSSLFKRIVDQGVAMGCKTIKISGFGEPFLDKRLLDKIAYAKEQNVANVSVFTNGSLLDENMIKRVIDSGLDEIYFSIDSGKKRQFEEARRNISFDTVDRAVSEMVAMKKRCKSEKPRVSINSVESGKKNSNIKSVFKRYQGQVDRISVQMAHNWTVRGHDLGIVQLREDFSRQPCPYPYFYMMIRHNGDVSICCFDFDCRTVLGNLEAYTLNEIWTGPAMKKTLYLLEQGRRSEIAACSECSQYPNWWAKFD